MRFGLLGTGPWAGRTHGPALAAHDDVELVGVWGRRAEAAETLATRLDTRAYADPDALLADCDAVAVALPPDVQAPLAVRAAEAGRHLLLDKPLATTVEGAREVTAAVERAGVASVVFFTLHFTASTARWLDEQRAVGDGAGGWMLGRADWFSPVFADSDSPYAASPWRRDKGPLWDIGPHALSVLVPLLGAVTSVRGARGAGDTVHLTLRHEGGASSTATLSHTVPAAASGVVAEVRGDAGVASLPERDESPESSFAHAVDALLSSARGEAPHPCDAHFAESITQLLTQAQSTL
ncbi:Gfo/Idh/MocA family protein [Streptomyces sp. NPDC048172]|uniref:Gfo/Idh/MocA family protein n=1 Tax=Streptomyces sp. NPDC048172 TaxID=3365505 RepID=UPI003715BF61